MLLRAAPQVSSAPCGLQASHNWRDCPERLGVHCLQCPEIIAVHISTSIDGNAAFWKSCMFHVHCCAEMAGKATFGSAWLIWNMENAIFLVGLCCCGPADTTARRLRCLSFRRSASV